MKKNFFVVLALLCALHMPATAQNFNNIYSITGYETYGASMAILNSLPDRKDIVFSAVGYDPTTPNYTISKVWLVKTDSMGVVQYAMRRDTSCGGLERVLETEDGGFILASWFSDFILVEKFTTTLTSAWAIKVPHPAYTISSPTIYQQIGLCKATYPNNPPNARESYFVTYSAGRAGAGSYTSDLNVSVSRVEQNGNISWHKDYEDNNRASGPQVVADNPSAIVAYTNPNNSNETLLTVVGTRSEYDPFQTINLFSLTINDNGQVVSDYQKIQTSYSSPYNPDVAWDGDSLVMTYIEKVTAGGPPIAPGVASVVGFIKHDAAYSGWRGHTLYDECENYGYNVTIGSDGNYRVYGYTGKCSANQSIYMPTAIMLKLDRGNLNKLDYYRYNTGGNTTPYSPVNVHRTNNMDEDYMIPSKYKTIGGIEIQMIRTNAYFNACEAHTFPINEDDYTPSATQYEYVANDFPEFFETQITWIPETINSDQCVSASMKQTAAVAAVKGNSSTVVIPTLVHNRAAEDLTCKFELGTATAVDILVTNSIGQVLYKQSHTVSNGSISIDGNLLSKGMNIVRCSSNGNVLNTTKVSVVE